MKINQRLINKDLRQHLIYNNAYEAFLGNVDNDRFTRLSTATMQLLYAFDFKKSAEGETYWKNLYLQLCE